MDETFFIGRYESHRVREKRAVDTLPKGISGTGTVCRPIVNSGTLRGENHTNISRLPEGHFHEDHGVCKSFL